MKTDDLDILIPRPLKGKAFDLAGYLQRLGFSRHFNADGSTYFSGGGMKVDFLAKEGREGVKRPRLVRGMAVTPQELRYLEILFAEPLVLKVARGVCVFRGIPAGYSDGKRPPFRAKPATHSDGKAATFRPVVGKVAGMARKIRE